MTNPIQTWLNQFTPQLDESKRFADLVIQKLDQIRYAILQGSTEPLPTEKYARINFSVLQNATEDYLRAGPGQLFSIDYVSVFTPTTGYAEILVNGQQILSVGNTISPPVTPQAPIVFQGEQISVRAIGGNITGVIQITRKYVDADPGRFQSGPEMNMVTGIGPAHDSFRDDIPDNAPTPPRGSEVDRAETAPSTDIAF